MLSSHVIPILWFRLVVLIGFTIFAVWQSMGILTVMTLLFIGLTIWQMFTAYRNRDLGREG